jgi:hypothetical protein
MAPRWGSGILDRLPGAYAPGYVMTPLWGFKPRRDVRSQVRERTRQG